MALAQTKAATIIQQRAEELSSHQVISLLMDGALERVGQARDCLEAGQRADADIVVTKLMGIINGLRSSLNLDAGGEIAVNLDALYSYMVDRLGTSESHLEALSEIGQLMGELKAGWDEMDGDFATAC